MRDIRTEYLSLGLLGRPPAAPGLLAVRHAELVNDVRDVSLDRPHAYDENPSDLLVVALIGDERNDLALPRGQEGKTPTGVLAPPQHSRHATSDAGVAGIVACRFLSVTTQAAIAAGAGQPADRRWGAINRRPAR